MTWSAERAPRHHGAARALLLLLALLSACEAPARVEGDSGLAGGQQALVDAFREKRSDLIVELRAPVARLLPDDQRGSRHQRFIIELATGQTVLVAHNIDLAPRAPVAAGTVVEIRGEYEWNPKGGVLHWTHHDPAGRRPGGWIRVDGRSYR